MSSSWALNSLNELPEVRFEFPNLRCRRLEVVGTRKNARERRRHATGEGACLPCARPFSLWPTSSKRLLRMLRISFYPDWKLTMDFFSKPIMGPTQVGAPEQGFRRCFAEGLNQSLVSSVQQAKITLSHCI